MQTLKNPSLLRRAPWTWASHRKSHVLPAPQRIEELLHGHDCDSVDTPRAGLKAHANMTLELPLLGEGPQRAHVPGRDDFLGLHLDSRVVAEDEVHLEPRGRSPIAEWLSGDIVAVRDELVHEIGHPPRRTRASGDEARGLRFRDFRHAGNSWSTSVSLRISRYS